MNILESKMAANPSASLNAFLEDFHDWRLKEFPEYATTADVHVYNHLLETLSLSKFDERTRKCEIFLSRLHGIAKDELTEMDMASYDLIEDHLNIFIEGYKWRYYSACNPVSYLENIHVNFKSFLMDATPFARKQDFTCYANRLQCVPAQIDEQIELMKEAIINKTTLHRLSVEKVPLQLAEILELHTEQHPFYEPCKNHIGVIEGKNEQKEVLNLIRGIIEESVNPSFSKLKNFLETEYLLATRIEIGVTSLPDGKQFYQACLKWHLSTDSTAEEVHQTGLKEVSRLKDCMQDVMNEVKFTGNLQEFITHLRETKSFYHTSKDALLSEYKNIVEKRINPKLQMLFHEPPLDECAVREMPFDGPGGQYTPPDDNGSRPGVFHVNLSHPTTIPKFGMTVLTLHEANPGHHMQFSIARHQPLPEFRRKICTGNQIYSVPFIFPAYTAYCEGWALYSEDLGIEMDIYNGPYELFGKLTDEMLRACRLVVDTGLHCFNWTQEKALQYMMSYCMLPVSEIENEVCRYITWPGQACAYKTGQLKIKELRQLAEKELGSLFDVKKFHDIILNMSSVPLHLLEKHIKVWIKEQKASN